MENKEICDDLKLGLHQVLSNKLFDKVGSETN